MEVHFDETDIDFRRLSADQFEELCYDLLVAAGFSNPEWRRGGADMGRDLEATLTWHSPLVGQVSERWAFECKNHRAGVRTEEISSKIAWAKAIRASKLVIFTASYLTTNCRTYVELEQSQTATQILVVEGKRLKQLILRNPLLVEKYFLTYYQKALRQALLDYWVQRWYLSPEKIAALSCTSVLEKYEPRELALLVVSCQANAELVEVLLEDDGHPSLQIDDVAERLLVVGDRRPKCVSDELKPLKVETMVMGCLPGSELQSTYIRGRFCFDAVDVDGDYLALDGFEGGLALEVILGRTAANELACQVYAVPEPNDNFRGLFSRVLQSRKGDRRG